MPLFSYKGRDAGGKVVEGSVDGVNQGAIASDLITRGITPVTIAERKEEIQLENKLNAFFEKKTVSLDELIIFCRQMYSLSKAGVPILRALKGLAESSHSPVLGRVVVEIKEDIETGHELSKSVAKHNRIFPPIFVAMVQVGENTGRLDEGFKHISEYLEMERETKKRIKQATRYPTMVVCALLAALLVINFFVIPSFAQVFSQLKTELPLPTRILMASSEFLLEYWWLLLAGIVGAGFGLNRYIKTDEGKVKWDRMKLKIPLIGGIFTRVTLTRFSRAFAMMLDAGVPILQTLNVTARAVGNEYMAEQVRGMRDGIERGESFSRTATASGMFTPLVLQMIAVGEESGSIDTMLVEVADFYESEVDYDLKRLSDAIEPILIVGLAGIVLVLALGVFLPVWELSTAMNG